MALRKVHGPGVKAIREALGISLRGLAGDLDIDSGYLSRIEQRKQITTSPALVAAIASRLGVSIDAVTYPEDPA